MAIRASIFHESVALRELRELFSPPSQRALYDTRDVRCAECQARFAVFFHVAEDVEDDKIRIAIRQQIADDCKHGKHSRAMHVDD